MKGDVGLNVGAALGAFGSAAMPYIEEALDQGDERTAYHALFAAAVLGPKAAPLSGRIVALLGAVDANVRVQAARTLAKIGPAGAAGVPGILGLLHDGTLTAVQAAPILMALGKPAQTAIHAELTGSGSTGDRERVLEVLAAFTGRTAFAFDALGPYLSDRAASTRRLAVQAVLAALEPPRDSLASRPWENTVLVANVRKLLEAMRDDPNKAIRLTVSTALEQLDQRAR